MSTITSLPASQSDKPTLHDNLGPAIIAGTVLCAVLATAFLAIRIWRSVNIKSFRWDDGLLVVSTILLTATAGLIAASVPFGEGQHVWDIANPSNIRSASRLMITAIAVDKVALLFAKVSVCVMLLQIKLGKSCNAILICATSVGVLGNLLVVIDLLAGCNTYWLFHNDFNSYCLPSSMFKWTTIFRGVANAIQDVVLVVAPIWYLRHVNMSSRDRRAVNIMLCLLLAGSVFAVAKAVLIPSDLATVTDVTWRSAHIWCLDPAETALSIMAACLPALRQVMKKRVPEKWRHWARPGRTAQRQSTRQTSNFSNRFSLRSGGQGTLLPSHSSELKFESLNSRAAFPLLPKFAWRKIQSHTKNDTLTTTSRTSSEIMSPPRPPPPAASTMSRQVFNYCPSDDPFSAWFADDGGPRGASIEPAVDTDNVGERA